MASLGEKIALLTNPTPQVLDPEDAINFDTLEKVSPVQLDESEIDDVSDLRRKTAPLLEDIDPAYAGIKVSRKDLGALFNEDKKKKKANHVEVNESLSESDVSDEDDDISDSELMNFQQLMSDSKKSDNLDEDYGSEDESELASDDPSNEEDYSEEDENSESEADSNDDIGTANDEKSQQLANIDVSNDLERGEAVKKQLELWSRLMEARIKLQKLLIISNKLPQSVLWKKLKLKGGKDFKDNSKQAVRGVRNLLKSLIELQSDLVEKSSDMQKLVNVENGLESKEDDEEIPSDTDEEQHQKVGEVENKAQKRKKDESFEDILEKRFKSLIPYRNSVIQKWDEKTKLSTGRMTQKSFNAFDNSALKQIDQILQDRNRLIRRTQLKRTLYRVLGKPEETESVPDSVEKPKSKQDMLLKDYDPEIFDDDDFYRQILKDVIESKSIGIDPAILRKQLEIQKVRSKMKRKVDTRASKGRKLRYDVHPKLVNFMAPVQVSGMPDEARKSFVKYLFGGNIST